MCLPVAAERDGRDRLAEWLRPSAAAGVPLGIVLHATSQNQVGSPDGLGAEASER